MHGVSCCSVTERGCRKGGTRPHGFATFSILTNLNLNSHMHLSVIVLEGAVLEPSLGLSSMDRSDFTRQESVWECVNCYRSHASEATIITTIKKKNLQRAGKG